VASDFHPLFVLPQMYIGGFLVFVLIIIVMLAAFGVFEDKD